MWLQRLRAVYPKTLWLNPEPEKHWNYTPSIGMTRELMDDHMYPMTLEGMDRAVSYLRR